MNRLINKFPHLVETKIDTIIVQDTLVIENYDTTVLSKLIKQDSVTVIDNSKVYLKYYYDTLRETIIHQVDCFGDTIFYYKEVPFEVEKVVYKELTWWQEYKHIIIIFALLILALIILKKFGKLI